MEDTSLFNPVKTIDINDLNSEFPIASVNQKFPNNFKRLGKTKDYQVKLYSAEKIKPVLVPTVPYILQAGVVDSLENMIKNDVIEERPNNEAAPLVPCAVIFPKDDHSLHVTLDAHNLNMALISTNGPIPKEEGIKGQLSGSNILAN